jgi:hypothetical protein
MVGVNVTHSDGETRVASHLQNKLLRRKSKKIERRFLDVKFRWS